MPARHPTILPIEARSLTIVGSEGQLLIDKLCLTVAGAGTLVILGPNGAGKSLLLRALAGLIKPNSGEVMWAGHCPSVSATKCIGFAFQKPVLFRRSVLANVELALRQSGYDKASALLRARNVLQAAGLEAFAQAPARRLSGGEQQRLAVARALATSPEVLFLDEPTAHLDPASTAAIEGAIKEAARNGVRVVHVTHDLSQAKRLGDEIVFLNRGRIEEHQPAADFFANPNSEPARAYLSGELII